MGVTGSNKSVFNVRRGESASAPNMNRPFQKGKGKNVSEGSSGESLPTKKIKMLVHYPFTDELPDWKFDSAKIAWCPLPTQLASEDFPEDMSGDYELEEDPARPDQKGSGATITVEMKQITTVNPPVWRAEKISPQGDDGSGEGYRIADTGYITINEKQFMITVGGVTGGTLNGEKSLTKKRVAGICAGLVKYNPEIEYPLLRAKDKYGQPAVEVQEPENEGDDPVELPLYLMDVRLKQVDGNATVAEADSPGPVRQFQLEYVDGTDFEVADGTADFYYPPRYYECDTRWKRTTVEALAARNYDVAVASMSTATNEFYPSGCDVVASEKGDIYVVDRTLPYNVEIAGGLEDEGQYIYSWTEETDDDGVPILTHEETDEFAANLHRDIKETLPDVVDNTDYVCANCKMFVPGLILIPDEYGTKVPMVFYGRNLPPGGSYAVYGDPCWITTNNGICDGKRRKVQYAVRRNDRLLVFNSTGVWRCR